MEGAIAMFILEKYWDKKLNGGFKILIWHNRNNFLVQKLSLLCRSSKFNQVCILNFVILYLVLK